MKNYRIQKLSYGDYVRYVPQQKVLGLFGGMCLMMSSLNIILMKKQIKHFVVI